MDVFYLEYKTPFNVFEMLSCFFILLFILAQLFVIFSLSSFDYSNA